jgi:hypothetical protein
MDHGGHAGTGCSLLDDVGVRGRTDQLPNVFGHFQNFEYAVAAAISGAAATLATDRPMHIVAGLETE